MLIAVVAGAALFRLAALDSAPPPLNQDEASRGYDAWCLLETGADRHGARWPCFLESFGPGDFTAALSTYLTMPFVAALGPSVAAMRLPDALLGVATVLLVFLWLRRHVGPRFALAAAAVLAFDPWHIALCRTAHESGFAPFFFVVGLMALHFSGLLPKADLRFANQGASTNADDDGLHPGPSARSRQCWAFVAGVMLALHTWVYPATRLFTPLFCLALLFVYRKHLRSLVRSSAHRGVVCALLGGGMFGSIPLWMTALRHPEQLAARSRAAVVFFQDMSAGRMVSTFLRNYALNFSPHYWFLQADDMSGIVMPGVGLHLAVLAPLWLVGLLRMLREARRSHWARLLLAWLILFPLPAAVCRDWNPHVMRTVSGMILFPIIAAVGLEVGLRRPKLASDSIRTPVVVVGCLALLANIAHFAQVYFKKFPPLARIGYQTHLARAMKYAAEEGRDAEFVLVTNRANQPYIYALLFEPIPPRELAESGLTICDGPLGFHQVIGVGRYVFAPWEQQRRPEAGRRYEELAAARLEGHAGLLITEVQHDKNVPDGAIPVYRTDEGEAEATIASRHYVVWRWRPPPGSIESP